MADAASRRDEPGPPRAPVPVFRSVVGILLLFAVGLLLVRALLPDLGAHHVPYSEFEAAVDAGRFRAVEFGEGTVKGLPAAGPAGAKVEQGLTEPPPWIANTVPGTEAELARELKARGIQYAATPGAGLAGELAWIVPLLLVILFWSWMARRVGGQPGASQASMLSFGKMKARVHVESDTGVSFQDVAGIDEAVEELREIVEFLRTPEKFRRLGGRIPKGVLLVGPPGTGKTLLARAVAGEAGVPFFSLTGSQFVEMFVGVGAARVRDLFEQAQARAPCIVFIDELDAIGRSRGIGLLTHEEREQTLNQLLAEMDGFDPRVGLIVLSATNRPEILDPALLRPGRFDRQVLVDRPDKRGRERILAIHAKRVLLGDDVDLSRIAAETPGFAGADLANVVNEAALLAARRGRDRVGLGEFEEAIERAVAGLEKKSRRLNERERAIVARHEAGHAIVGWMLPEAERVRKVSIVPRGIAALGYTAQRPLEDRYLMTEPELRAKIATLLGGRAAEELGFGQLSTGSATDLQQASDLARAMVRDYGMSPALGPVALGDEHRPLLLGPQLPQEAERRGISETTRQAVDGEVHRLLEEGLATARQILDGSREKLAALASRLLEREVVEEDELARLLGPKAGDHPSTPRGGVFAPAPPMATAPAGPPPAGRG